MVLLRSLQGVPESAPSLSRVLCQLVLPFPKLTEQQESSWSQLFQGDVLCWEGISGAEPQGFRRVCALLEYTNPGQFIPAWLVIHVLKWSGTNPLPRPGGGARFGINCFGKVPLRL